MIWIITFFLIASAEEKPFPCRTNPQEYQKSIAQLLLQTSTESSDLGRFSHTAKSCLKDPRWKGYQKCLQKAISADLSRRKASQKTPGNPDKTAVPPPLLSEELENTIFLGQYENALIKIDQLIAQGQLPKGTLATPFEASLQNIFAANHGGVDKKRFMIFIPGNPQKYVAVGVTEDTDKYSSVKKAPVMSVVSVETVGSQTTTHYGDYETSPKIGPERHFDFVVQNCDTCHYQAPLSMANLGLEDSTLPIELENRFRDNFVKINDAMRKDSQKVTQRYLDAGPLFGDKSSPFDEGFINSCVEDIIKRRKKDRVITTAPQQVQLKKFLGEQIMSCNSCHSHSNPNHARPIYAAQVDSNHMKHHILSGNMPRNQKIPEHKMNFTVEQREDLLSCITLWPSLPGQTTNAYGKWLYDRIRCEEPSSPEDETLVDN